MSSSGVNRKRKLWRSLSVARILMGVTDMGRLFSMLLLFAVMLCPAGGKRQAYAQPVFFSMLFPQLIPQWMLNEGAEGVTL